jgi:acyl-CoA thioester hydrolase
VDSPFTYETRAAFADTDAMGVVHHANYLRYCEEARVAWMRDNFLTSTHYPENDRVLAVLQYQVWHKRPARFDDKIRVRLQVRNVGVRIQFQYTLHKVTAQGEEHLANAETLHIPVDTQLKPQRPNALLMQQLEKEPWIETWHSNL